MRGILVRSGAVAVAVVAVAMVTAVRAFVAIDSLSDTCIVSLNKTDLGGVFGLLNGISTFRGPWEMLV